MALILNSFMCQAIERIDHYDFVKLMAYQIEIAIGLPIKLLVPNIQPSLP
jgi:hypothetical protein